ncbi:MAG: ABC transporter permease [Bacteroidales bacterium]
MNFWKNTKAVLIRERDEMFNRPLYTFWPIVVLLFSLIFFTSFMHEGLPSKLPIGVVDYDETPFTRNIIRQLNAEEGVGIIKHYSNNSEARQALQLGKIYGYILMPHDFYSDVLGNKRPDITYYVNDAYLVGGNLANKAFLEMSNLISGAYQRSVLETKGVPKDQIMGLIKPIVIDSHLIGNTKVHYGIYLVNTLIPGIFELMCMFLTIFAIGYELKMKTSREWLKTANGSMAAAMTGKMIPYTLMFLILGVAYDLILYKLIGYPNNGNIGNMILDISLLVLASEAIGIFIIGMFPILRQSIFTAAFYGLLGFSLSGFTYPVEYMHPGVQGLSQIYPIRHYFMFYCKEVIFDTGFAGWWIQVAALLAFLILPFFIYHRLERALINQNFPTL